jgi:hypothetical protein
MDGELVVFGFLLLCLVLQFRELFGFLDIDVEKEFNKEKNWGRSP